MLTPAERSRNFSAGLAEAERFFMGEAKVQEAALRLAAALREMRIPYALVGGLAVGVHGYERMTTDVDVLMTAENLRKFKERWVGLGWKDVFPGSKNMRDVVSNVGIDVLLTGDYPGDGKPKPVKFPSPGRVYGLVGGTRIIRLGKLIELKLASGMSAPDRLKDLDDVIHLIRANKLTKAYILRLHPWVRRKYTELWLIAQHPREAESPAWRLALRGRSMLR